MLRLPAPHPAQHEVLASPARFRVVICGRRFGKTEIGKREILQAAVNGKACWWLAPTYQMTAHVWRDLRAAVRHLPTVTLSQSHRRIDFPGGGWLEVHSAHTPNHLRGAGLDFVVLDEAAFMQPEVWAEVVRPMLVETQGSAIFLSSPNGKNWLYHLYQQGLQSHPAPEPHPMPLKSDPPTTENFPLPCLPGATAAGDEVAPAANPPLASSAFSLVQSPSEPISPEFAAVFPPLSQHPHEEGAGVSASISPSSTQSSVLGPQSYASFTFPTSANPLISPQELEAIRREVPERIWHVEYQAQFAEDLGQVFRGIQAAATAPWNVTPDPDGRYVIGIDWARMIDYTAMIVMDARTKAVVAIDRFNHVTWQLQRGRLKALCDRWNPRVIYAEENNFGSPNIEALQHEGMPVRGFNTSGASKPKLIDSLSLAIERREIALQPHEALLSELAAYGYELLPGGGYRYSSPSGLHDDLVIALALAYYGSQRSGLPILSA